MPNLDALQAPAPTRNAAGRAITAVIAAIAVVVAIAGLEFYALLPHETVGELARTAAEAPSPPATIGSVESPAAEGILGPAVSLSGWALDPSGIKRIEVRLDGNSLPAKSGLERNDIAAAHPGYLAGAKAGFSFEGDFSSLPARRGADRRELTVVAIANDGRETLLATKSVIDPGAFQRWQSIAGPAPAALPSFHLLPALSAISLGGARDLERWYAPYLSPTIGIGMRVPILYLRMTRGRAQDYVFDPDWDIERRCGTRRIAEDSLNATIAHAVAHKLPVLFTLNGGIWADAGCDVPDWDLNDHLEEVKSNCQWNEKDEVMPDDTLKHLPGSMDAPELGRSLTFNVYAADVRRYKRRNLQAAARIVTAFAREHPDLFVGITLDPDTYVNPFFEGRQWYDYNPGTLKQFRHWLAATGPYGGVSDAPGVPDLARYRRSNPLTLAEVNRLADRDWKRWSEVDPPRAFPVAPAGGRPAFWSDPWAREWEVFRRHLVHLHYDELSQWASEAGLPQSRIWSGQGFMAPSAGVPPFAIHLESPMKTYDTGGMSIEGAHPKYGHLGAILYGPAAANDIRMEEPASLFATLRAQDPDWAVVEINTADLRKPKALPTYETAYRTLRDLFNFGARYASPMAWNGSDGNDAGKRGYVSYTAWRNTPFEEAARDFLLAHAYLPRGARLWTFGSTHHADADGWSADAGAIVPGPGHLDLKPIDGGLTITSPRELALRAPLFDRLVLGIEDPRSLMSVRVLARTAPAAPWLEVARVSAASQLTATLAGIVVPMVLTGDVPFDQLRLELQFMISTTTHRLDHVALWPAR